MCNKQAKVSFNNASWHCVLLTEGYNTKFYQWSHKTSMLKPPITWSVLHFAPMFLSLVFTLDIGFWLCTWRLASLLSILRIEKLFAFCDILVTFLITVSKYLTTRGEVCFCLLQFFVERIWWLELCVPGRGRIWWLVSVKQQMESTATRTRGDRTDLSSLEDYLWQLSSMSKILTPSPKQCHQLVTRCSSINL